MDENKNYETEEITEATEETVEAVEEVAEEVAAEEFVEEAAEEISEETTEEPVEEVAEEPVVTEVVPEPEETKKGSKKVGIIAVIVALIVIAAAIVTSTIDFNKYNRMGYVDISGQTIGDLAEQQGITLEEFLDMYSLPKDMTADTTEAAAYYNIPVGRIAQMYGMDFETLKTTLNLGAEVVAETPWGVAEGEVTLGDYVGAENVDAFKAQYALGEDVTAETKWKEIRNIVDTEQKLAREAAEKEAEAEQTPAEDVQAEAPVDDAAETEE